MDGKRLALIALCAALTAAGAFIRIPLWPVAITLQTFFVVLAGMVLGSRDGALSQIVYIIVGLLGLPVFSGGGGFAYLMQPSLGYLLGFVAAPVVVGLLLKGRGRSYPRVFAASLAGSLVIYAVGVPYLAGYMHIVMKKPDALSLAIKTGALVFVPGDLVKCLILTLIVPKLRLESLGRTRA